MKAFQNSVNNLEEYATIFQCNIEVKHLWKSQKHLKNKFFSFFPPIFAVVVVLLEAVIVVELLLSDRVDNDCLTNDSEDSEPPMKMSAAVDFICFSLWLLLSLDRLSALLQHLLHLPMHLFAYNGLNQTSYYSRFLFSSAKELNLLEQLLNSKARYETAISTKRNGDPKEPYFAWLIQQLIRLLF